MTEGPQYPEYPNQSGAGQSGAGDQPPPQYGQAPQPPPQYGQAPPPQYGQPAYGQAPYGYPTYGPPPGITNQMAVWSMVMGIVSLAFCFVGLLVGPVAIGLALTSRRAIRESRGTQTGDGMALVGLITGSIGTAIWGVILALFIIGLSVG